MKVRLWYIVFCSVSLASASPDKDWDWSSQDGMTDLADSGSSPEKALDWLTANMTAEIKAMVPTEKFRVLKETLPKDIREHDLLQAILSNE